MEHLKMGKAVSVWTGPKLDFILVESCKRFVSQK